jgi:hypothetical protein
MNSTPTSTNTKLPLQLPYTNQTSFVPSSNLKVIPFDLIPWEDIGKLLFELPQTSTKSIDGYTLDLVRRAYSTVLQDILQHNHSDPRYLKRYIFLPKILFPSKGTNKNRTDDIRKRANDIIERNWSHLKFSTLVGHPSMSYNPKIVKTPTEVATNLVKRGLISKAFQRLQSPPLPPITDNTFQLFQSLHPTPPTNTPSLPDITEPPTLSLKPASLYSTIHNTKKGVAPGITGLRSEHLKLLTRSFRIGDNLLLLTCSWIFLRSSPPINSHLPSSTSSTRE